MVHRFCFIFFLFCSVVIEVCGQWKISTHGTNVPLGKLVQTCFIWDLKYKHSKDSILGKDFFVTEKLYFNKTGKLVAGVEYAKYEGWHAGKQFLTIRKFDSRGHIMGYKLYEKDEDDLCSLFWRLDSAVVYEYGENLNLCKGIKNIKYGGCILYERTYDNTGTIIDDYGTWKNRRSNFVDRGRHPFAYKRIYNDTSFVIQTCTTGKEWGGILSRKKITIEKSQFNHPIGEIQFREPIPPLDLICIDDYTPSRIGRISCIETKELYYNKKGAVDSSMRVYHEFYKNGLAENHYSWVGPNSSKTEKGRERSEITTITKKGREYLLDMDVRNKDYSLRKTRHRKDIVYSKVSNNSTVATYREFGTGNQDKKLRVMVDVENATTIMKNDTLKKKFENYLHLKERDGLQYEFGCRPNQFLWIYCIVYDTLGFNKKTEVFKYKDDKINKIYSKEKCSFDSTYIENEFIQMDSYIDSINVVNNETIKRHFKLSSDSLWYLTGYVKYKWFEKSVHTLYCNYKYWSNGIPQTIEICEYDADLTKGGNPRERKYYYNIEFRLDKNNSYYLYNIKGRLVDTLHNAVFCIEKEHAMSFDYTCQWTNYYDYPISIKRNCYPNFVDGKIEIIVDNKLNRNVSLAELNYVLNMAVNDDDVHVRWENLPKPMHKNIFGLYQKGTYSSFKENGEPQSWIRKYEADGFNSLKNW
ncbi:MAG: hypothetical protein J6X18_00220 [Bacteroidales bacterium]|nr:hypothetical protein [Bacteroidales bacterium]